MKKKRKKWTTKYLKLTLNKEGTKMYNHHLKLQYQVKYGEFWGIVAETEPGNWEVIHKGHERFDDSSPFPLNIQDGYTPNCADYDYEELTEEEIFLEKI